MDMNMSALSNFTNKERPEVPTVHCKVCTHPSYVRLDTDKLAVAITV